MIWIVSNMRWLGASAGGIPIAVDSLMIVLFAWCLVATRSASRTGTPSARVSV